MLICVKVLNYRSDNQSTSLKAPMVRNQEKQAQLVEALLNQIK